MSPFSGISLVIHLAIIGLGKLISLFKKPHSKSAHRPQEHSEGSWLGRSMNRSASILIVLVVFTVMLASFARAVKTGIREGSKESQVQFVHHQISAIKQMQWGTILPFNEVEAQRSEALNAIVEPFFRP